MTELSPNPILARTAEQLSARLTELAPYIEEHRQTSEALAAVQALLDPSGVQEVFTGQQVAELVADRADMPEQLTDEQLMEAARALGAPFTVKELAGAVQQSERNLRYRIRKLVKADRLRVTGSKRTINRGPESKLYSVVTVLEPGAKTAKRRTPVAFSHEQVRDAVVAFGAPFVVAELADTLGRAQGTVAPHLAKLEARGIVERTGRRRRAAGKVKGMAATEYRYVAPSEPGAAAKLDLALRPSERPGRGGSGAPVPGTGRPVGSTSKEASVLIAQVKAHGASVEMNGAGHWKVRDSEGRAVGSIPATPSDHRSLKNTQADLRRNGVGA